MSENIIREKTYQFALKVVLVCRELTNQKEYILSKQLLRSATSIGANVEEGIQGQKAFQPSYKLLCPE